MNKRLQKIVNRLQEGKRTIRRDQIQKAYLEGGFDTMKVNPYDEVYHMESYYVTELTEDLIPQYWWSGCDLWANIEEVQGREALKITLKFGYTYKSLIKFLDVVEVEEVPTTEENTNNIELSTLDVTIEESKHTKTNATIYLVKLNNKVSREEYLNILSVIKSHNGYYSKYTKSFVFNEDPTELFYPLDRVNYENIELTATPEDEQLLNVEVVEETPKTEEVKKVDVIQELKSLYNGMFSMDERRFILQTFKNIHNIKFLNVHKFHAEYFELYKTFVNHAINVYNQHKTLSTDLLLNEVSTPSETIKNENNNIVDTPATATTEIINIDDIENYTIDKNISDRENNNSMFRTQKINHTQEIQNILLSWNNELIEALQGNTSTTIELNSKKKLQSLKKKYHNCYSRMITHKANNPSWVVTGRGGLNANRYNKKLNQYDKMLGEAVAIEKDFKKLISTTKHNIKKEINHALKVNFEVVKANTDISSIKFKRSKNNVLNGFKLDYTVTIYQYNNYAILSNYWGKYRVYSGNKEIGSFNTLSDAKVFVINNVQNAA